MKIHSCVLFAIGLLAATGSATAADRAAAIEEPPDARPLKIMPRLLRSQAPAVDAATATGLRSVRVVVRGTVDETGRLRAPVIEGSSAPEFNDSVLAALQTWRFSPATEDGKPTAVSIRLPLQLKLSQRAEALAVAK